ncbi:hypothetical protein GALMADRAFT_297648 [Galerina marginata CBS 339.88]|uniref:RBR-type E3 ubiquitin transferase n=1 Tax=Galerina marginata (strain CBS 339.88) TaxID=685588 RepID=A0A067TRC8_GALM3|nr:hypothetical protein GALMADRAFT_297648 [Galerina marginata CBS 339.88]
MDEDQNICSTLQLEEYEVLKAIYPDFISNDSIFTNDKIIHFKLSVELPAETAVQIVPPSTDGPRPPEVTITLQYLPPIWIDIFLPEEYPMQRPPEILRVHVDASWFIQEDALKSRLLESWQFGEAVLFSWIEFVRSGQFIYNLEVSPELEHSDSESIRLLYDNPGLLAQRLVDHNAKAKQHAFGLGTYECAVCLTTQKGTQCIRLSCSHVFCKPCLEQFWTIAVREGELSKIKCADPECMKVKKVAVEEEMQGVLSASVFSRWRWLKEKREFEKDIDHSYCPICENPVKRPDPDTGQEDAWARFRQCQNCNFSFCKACKCSWHGPHFECPVPLQILTRYIAATTSKEDTIWSQNLERKYSSWVLRLQVEKFKKEAERLRREELAQQRSLRSEGIKLSEEWLAKSTQCCPSCGAYIQRTEGCNFMVCSLCKQQFCYGCGKPYTTYRCC